MQLCNLVMKKMAAIKAFTRLTQVQAILDNAMGFFLSFFFAVFFPFFGNTGGPQIVRFHLVRSPV